MRRLTLAALIALITPLALAQSVVSTTLCIPDPGSTPSSAIPSLTYDVASIRENKSNDGRLSSRDPSKEALLTLSGITMKNLISDAYGVSLFDVAGGPSWLDTERFDIAAKSDDTVSAQLRKLNNCDVRKAKQQMLQALLSDRTKLAVHHVSKVVTGYDLVLAKIGSKLQPSKTAPDEANTSEAKPLGATMSMQAGKLGIDLTARNYSISSFAAWLSIGSLHTPVQDKTGLTGVYDFKLQWSQQDSAALSSSQDALYPDIFTALQEQLGLKLNPTKVTIDTIVIDHIEPPSPN